MSKSNSATTISYKNAGLSNSFKPGRTTASGYNAHIMPHLTTKGSGTLANNGLVIMSEQFKRSESNPKYLGFPTWGIVSVPELRSVLERLDALTGLPDNWNERGADAPKPEAVREAKTWVKTIFNGAKETGLLWQSPHVTADEEGAAVVDWKKGKKSLVLYVLPGDCLAIKAWGRDMESEMQDIIFKTASDAAEAYAWFIQE